jgi:CTP:molybdopterin cytidylyltransferase MocA
MTTLAGIVLAAGAGSRIGRPKALMRTADGEPWVARAAGLLRAAGCDRVLVVLGAAAAEATALMPADTDILVVENWADGMGESLRRALAAASGDAALITLVDLPELPLAVVERVLREGSDVSSLTQAVFGGRPGHPVLIGRAHWAAVSATLTGDHGARGYLVAHNVTEVECGDLWDGHDVDRLQ